MIRALCVSVHGAAPSTWRGCERLLAAVAMAGDIPVTLVVTPQREAVPGWFPRALAERVQRGDEVALCEIAVATALWRGRSWFHRNRLPLQGFVPADGRLNRQGWLALPAQGFRYTATRRHFHLLRPRTDHAAPCACYRARTWREAAWAFVCNRGHREPLARIALYPELAQAPALLAHAVALAEKLRTDRQPMTLRDLAQALRATGGIPSAGRTTPSGVPPRRAAARPPA